MICPTLLVLEEYYGLALSQVRLAKEDTLFMQSALVYLFIAITMIAIAAGIGRAYYWGTIPLFQVLKNEKYFEFQDVLSWKKSGLVRR